MIHAFCPFSSLNPKELVLQCQWTLLLQGMTNSLTMNEYYIGKVLEPMPKWTIALKWYKDQTLYNIWGKLFTRITVKPHQKIIHWTRQFKSTQ